MNADDWAILDEVDQLVAEQAPPPATKTARPRPARPPTVSLNADDLAILEELDELVPEQELPPATKKKTRPRPPKVRWIERDEDGHVIAKRPAVSRRQSGQAKPCHSRSAHPSTEACFDPDTASETVPGEYLLRDLLQYQSSSDDEPEEVLQRAPLANEDWGTRNALFSERWRAMRPCLVHSMLAQEKVATYICSQCGNNTAAVRCRDCLPCPFLCAECDISRHNKTLVLHNRDGMTGGFFRPLAPTNCIVDTAIRHCVRFLPIEMPVQICGCPPEVLQVSKGKDVTLVTINGRYDLSMPQLTCEGCQATWDAGVEHLVQNGYWPATLNFLTIYEADLFYTFEDMKMASPGLSLQAFLRMLDKRTVRFGRTGKISSDSFQKSFFEWAAVRSEIDSLCKEEPLCCPACTPSMLAVCVDGNRKHYRFKSTARSKEQAIFDGVFIANDEDVARFVGHIHSKIKHVPGRGVCGGEWTAARETSERSRSKVDEEGLELAVCRHGVLLAALNMFRGEIFAYPMFLQHQMSSKYDITFFCMDVACKYWPYLQKVCAHCPELQPLQNMRPFLSVVHAKAHDYKCEVKWSGANQDGAGSTLGEEVEQCNAFLSRIAVTTKHMSKEGRSDMLTLLSIRWNQHKVDNMANSLSQRYHKTSKVLKNKLADLESLKARLQLEEHNVEEYIQDVKDWADGETEHQGTLQTMCQKIEALTSSIKTRNERIYRENDSNKGRHRIRRKLRQEKNALKVIVEEYNSLVPEQTLCFDTILDTEHPWPWQITQSGSVDYSTKKDVFNKCMAVRRLQEEKSILVREMRQHWDVLKARASVLSQVSLHQSEGHLPEDARRGLMCLIRRKEMELRDLKRRVRKLYIDVMSSTDDTLVDPVDNSDELFFFSSESESSDSEVDAL